MSSDTPNLGNLPLIGNAGRTTRWTIALTLAVVFGVPSALRSESFNIDIDMPGGGTFSLPIELKHIDNGGSLLTASTPAPPPFNAPTIFSAPLPSGSGARALGVAGAFTAVADDATAASWNPAGLTQLERPEFSVVYRLNHERDQHWSSDSDYRVGEDSFYANALNYMSAVMPFRLWDRSAVFSLNYQEVFDFSQRFHANFTDRSSKATHEVSNPENTQETVTTPYDFGPMGNLSVTEFLTTHKTTTLDQTTASATLGQLDFDQEGTVQAITPAFAMEVAPKVSLGAALNVYQEGLMGTPQIHSRTRARYSGTLDSRTTITDLRTTDGTYTYDGIWYREGMEPIFFGADGVVPPYSTTETSAESAHYRYTGTYDIDDRINGFRGVNATLGSLWNVSEQLTLGFCLDLPWTAHARQTKTVRSHVEVHDASGATVGSNSSTTRESKDVTFEFPLYWSMGSVWHWNNRLSTSFDVSQTWWSDYSFKAEGERRKNPLDGSDYGERPLDDCWALRTGTEYLWVLSHTEIPFRAGLSWEQRPAVDRPDEYYGISLGTGISIGKGPNKVIIDVAYIYSWGTDVMGTLVPGQEGNLSTDVQRHDIYVSCIYHF